VQVVQEEWQEVQDEERGGRCWPGGQEGRQAPEARVRPGGQEVQWLEPGP